MIKPVHTTHVLLDDMKTPYGYRNRNYLRSRAYPAWSVNSDLISCPTCLRFLREVGGSL